ncbi:MAG: Omp28-related outer membrane protein [Bacteroidales bacterium]|nr:Omp28-related outer membrane protein [Bacteroidales bacterium]
MKKLLLSTGLCMLVCTIAQTVWSQNYVNTQPADKNVILEEFTGVKCPNCPQGHQIAQQIIQNNPGRVWVIGFHPYNSSYTQPYPNDPDFRRHHPDSLYMTPYCGTTRFMPSAFINRKIYGGERLQSRTVWASYTTQHLGEPSPVNVGLATDYDSITKQLAITVEIYYTATMSDPNTLNLALTESGLIAQQSGGSTNYVHNHVFRETFTAQWGDPITESTAQGSFIEKFFTYDNTSMEYNMEECEVIAYIVNAASEEVMSGIGVHVGEYTSFTPPTAQFTVDDPYVPTGGSAQFTDMSTGGPSSWDWTFEGGDPSTFSGQIPPAITYNSPGEFQVSLTVTNINGSNTETKEDFIHVADAPVANFSYTMTFNPDETVVDFTDLSTGDPALWEWTFEGGTPPTSLLQNPSGIVYTIPGNYNITLTVISLFGTDTKTEEIWIDVISSLTEEEWAGAKICPNPCNGVFHIALPDGSLDRVQMWDSKGVLAKDISHRSQFEELIIEHHQPGIYFLRIHSTQGTITRKLVIQ